MLNAEFRMQKVKHVLTAMFVVAGALLVCAQQGAPPQPGPPAVPGGAPGAGAQGGGRGRGGAPAPPVTGRAQSPYDISGYWVALVTDDWRYRMLTPPKGNADYIPVTPDARKVIDSWDPAKDDAAGEACRAYGAAGVMRLPGRLHITWENDNTLASTRMPVRRRACSRSAPRRLPRVNRPGREVRPRAGSFPSRVAAGRPPRDSWS